MSFKTTLIELEVIEKEYENTLQQYQEAINNYILNLTSETTDLNNTYVFLKGRTWWGTSELIQTDASSQEVCQSMCASDIKCSGATFNEVKKYCWTRTGAGRLTAGSDSDYAIITKQKEATNNLKMLNNRLLQLNEQILATIASLKPQEQTISKEMNSTHISLIKEYTKLLEQKAVIDKQINEYIALTETLDNQEIYVTQQSTQLQFWMLLMCLIILFTIKGLYGNAEMPIEIIFWFIIGLIFLVMSFTLRTPGGFFMLFLVIFYIVFFR